jgi:general secretion pathway protein C
MITAGYAQGMRLRIPLSPLLSLALFAGLCAIVAYWAMILLSPPPPIAPASQPANARSLSDPSRTASLFGQPTVSSPSAAVAAPVNVRILGVMTPPARTGQGSAEANAAGIALVSIDGQPARPYSVGDTLPNGLRVQAILKDRVEFSDQGRVVSSPAPAGADPSILVRGASANGATSASLASGLPGVRPASPTAPGAPSAAPGVATPPAASVPANETAGAGPAGQEAPMPPPPPLAPGGSPPGPVQMPSAR